MEWLRHPLYFVPHPFLGKAISQRCHLDVGAKQQKAFPEPVPAVKPSKRFSSGLCQQKMINKIWDKIEQWWNSKFLSGLNVKTWFFSLCFITAFRSRTRVFRYFFFITRLDRALVNTYWPTEWLAEWLTDWLTDLNLLYWWLTEYEVTTPTIHDRRLTRWYDSVTTPSVWAGWPSWRTSLTSLTDWLSAWLTHWLSFFVCWISVSE